MRANIHKRFHKCVEHAKTKFTCAQTSDKCAKDKCANVQMCKKPSCTKCANLQRKLFSKCRNCKFTNLHCAHFRLCKFSVCVNYFCVENAKLFL